jgi:enoyl-CoA hydratase/carnithine racemase
VVPRDELDATAMDVAQSIASRPPLAVRQHRDVLEALGTAVVDASLQHELLGQMLVYTSADFAEFRAARAEGREPDYRGT